MTRQANWHGPGSRYSTVSIVCTKPSAPNRGSGIRRRYGRKISVREFMFDTTFNCSQVEVSTKMRKPVDRYVKAMNRCHHGWREAGHLYFGMAQVIAAIACTSWLCTASGVLMEWRIDPPGVPFGQDPLTV